MRLPLVLALAALALAGCMPKEPDAAGAAAKPADATDTTKAVPPVTEVQPPKGAPSTLDKTDDKAKPAQETEQKPRPPIKRGTTTVVAYRNASGELVCPVMGTVIESEAKATGYQDYKGVRYYFCCDDCPAFFKKDPESWIKKQ